MCFVELVLDPTSTNNSFMELEYVTFKLYYKCAVKEDSAAWIRQYKVDGIFGGSGKEVSILFFGRIALSN
jgi:hypothetical protein